MIIDYIILGIYALMMFGVAIYTHNRSKSVNDFLLAGKKGLNGWMSAFAYGTTYFSAVIFIGYAGKYGAQYGLSAVWIGIGNAILGTLLAWIVLAKRTKNMTSRLQAKTMPEFFEKRYDSKNLKIFSAFIIFLFLIPYSASVYNGLTNFFVIVFKIPESLSWIVMVALALVTAIYLFFGGYFATALSDFIQGIIMIFGVVIMVIYFLNSEQVGWNLTELVTNPNTSWFTFNSTNKGFYGNTVTLTSLILLTSFGVWALPQTVHKYYAIRDKKAINQGTIVSTAFALIIGFSAYFVGALSGLFQSELAGVTGDNIMPSLFKLVIPTGLIGVITVLILSASMSTLSSVSLSGSSILAIDLYKGWIKKDASDKRTNIYMRVLCIVFIIISVVLAILNEKLQIAAIACLMGLSWGTLSGCFIGPFVLGLCWKKTTLKAVWTSVVGSLILTVALIFILGYDQNAWCCSFKTAIKSGINCSPIIGVICMAYSMLSTFIVSLFTSKPKQTTIDNSFNKHFEGEIQ